MIFFFTSQEIYGQIRSFPQRTRAAQKLPSLAFSQEMLVRRAAVQVGRNETEGG